MKGKKSAIPWVIPVTVPFFSGLLHRGEFPKFPMG